jgi:hypothetical protein
MAQMYPTDIREHESATEAQKEVHRFLQEAARPHGDFIAWHAPNVGGVIPAPDFILFGKKLGLLVLEVEDWKIHQVKPSNPFEFTLALAGGTVKKANPDKRAKGFVTALTERLKASPDFASEASGQDGNLGIPVGRMVVFPGIGREEYCARALQWLIPLERVLFREDLAADGDILGDPSGKKFLDRVSEALPFRFKGLSRRGFEKLMLILWPESQIALPLRKGHGKAHFQREVQALDEAQSKMALRLKPGHQIIKGPPGSGKTLVLVHHCSHLYKFQGKRRILFICFNIALVSYLKRLIREKRLGTGEAEVQVNHFFQLCSLILGEPLRYENEEAGYYNDIVKETLERLSKGRHGIDPFDAVFVDEGQDFSNEMLKALLYLLKDGGDFIIAMDTYQDVYRRKSPWSSLGIKATGRVHRLRKPYRNTAEIYRFSRCFLGREEAQDDQLALDLAFHGEIPQVQAFRSMEDLEEFLVEDIESSLTTGEYKRSEIAVIYDDKVYGNDGFAYDNRALPMRLLRRLEESGIPSTWVSQDVKAKESYDVTTDRVSLISIHSSKGLDFEVVYLVGMDRLRVTEKNRSRIRLLSYVAMTRAKYRLVIPYVEETELIRRMKSCLPFGGATDVPVVVESNKK